VRSWVVFTIVALFVTALSAATAAEKRDYSLMTGTITAVDANAMTLTVKQEVQGGGDEQMSFVVGPEATIRMHGLKSKLSQLKPGDVVTVTYKDKEGQHVATAIQHM
jgi:Cu/Ag efflux protein CusF